MARAVQASYVDGESTATAAARRQRRASSTVSAQRARLDLNDPALHDCENGINVQCGRREHNDGGGPTPKKGIEHYERTTSASRLEQSPCTMAGRREISDGGGPTPKKGIETPERTTSASRLE